MFVGGTASNAGKSWMTTAICASLRRRGVRVAPFKAQNMSNHSYPCKAGGEIGRAQVAQAEACGLAPEPAMNPILLKPNGNGTSQVIVHGRVWKTLSARDYYAHFDRLLPRVLEAYDDLARRFDFIVIEGAGSVSELNLRAHDLVNLGLVTRIGAPWVLVADIERGGVFGSVLGTVGLLTPAERALFKGFLINRFRGDRSLFDAGRDLLEVRSQSPCLGVFPFEPGVHLAAEDSLSVDRVARLAAPPGASLAIVDLPRLSNATDFRRLAWAEWVNAPISRRFDFVVIPGTKDTLGDLEWLQTRQLDAWVRQQHADGATIVGICGGFQMLGESVEDPATLESRGGRREGLALLPVRTVIEAEKTTALRQATSSRGTGFAAYEIHMGRTPRPESAVPFAWLDTGEPEGIVADRVIGTYLHGAFEDANVCAEIFGSAAADRVRMHAGTPYEALADWFDRHAERVGEWLL